MSPTLSVNVNLCNPGQVFACCGLFELAHRLTPSDKPALGWFRAIDAPRTQFDIQAFAADDSPITLRTIWNHIKKCSLEGDKAKKDGPVLLGRPFDFLIDWRRVYPQRELVKTWAGQQAIFNMTQSLRSALAPEPDIAILDVLTPISGCGTAFDISRSANALDAGFSLDKLEGYEAYVSAATELLSLIGLQRFCPAPDETRLGRRYYVWATALPIALAAVAVNNPLHGIKQRSLVYSMYERESKGRYKAFGTSQFVKEN